MYTYIYIYMCVCVLLCSSLGAFFEGSKMLPFCLLMQLFWNQKKRVSPRWNLFADTSSFQKYHLLSVIPCLQKRGTYVAQHRLPIIERIQAPHSWKHQFPLFFRLHSSPLKSSKPPFFSCFCSQAVFFPDPPPARTEGYFRLTKNKSKKWKRKSWWVTYPYKKLSEPPIFVAFPATKLKTVFFFTPKMQLFEAMNRHKSPRPGGQRLLLPNHSENQNIDPSLLAISKRPPERVPVKRQPRKLTQTNEQPRHEVEEATWGQSNEEKTTPR